MADERQPDPNLGRPIHFGNLPIFGVDPPGAQRTGALDMPGAQRELAHPAQRGRELQIVAGLPAGREIQLLSNLGIPGGHPTIFLAVLDRGTYSSFPWRARVQWNIGALGMMEAVFDVGALDNPTDRNPLQQGVVWSQPCDLLNVSIIVPGGGAVGDRPARVGAGVAWGAMPYAYRRPLTFREVREDLGAGQQSTFTVPAFARGVRISCSDSAAPAWTNGNAGLSFFDAGGARIGGDEMQDTSNLQTLVAPIAVPLGALTMVFRNQGLAPFVTYAAEWELSL